MPFFGYLYHAKKKSLRGLILSCQIAVSVSPTLAYLSRLSDLGYHFPQHSKKAKKNNSPDLLKRQTRCTTACTTSKNIGE